ncbi:MAG TPA: hypothetical protein VGP92_16690 [Acidimicrobiia bacterium]|jgi:hypothetical protein|nr:hypothetical protein [Acidimicrobiia bacterium]
MERKQALAMATAATLVLGAGIVAVASMTGASLLGFGGGRRVGGVSSTAVGQSHPSQPGVVVKTRNVYDRYVVDIGGGSATGASSSVGSATPGSGNGPATTSGRDPANNATTPTSKPAPGAPPQRATPAPKPGGTQTTPTTHAGTSTTTVVPNPTTTIPATTPTTWPRGVPKDWPKDKPIPPMPPNCRDPQLEDNGVWNCDH